MPTAGNPLGGEIVRRSYGRPAGPLAGSWLDQPRSKHLASHPGHPSSLRRFLHDRPPDRRHHLFDLAGHPDWLASGCDLGGVCAESVQNGSQDREGAERSQEHLSITREDHADPSLEGRSPRRQIPRSSDLKPSRSSRRPEHATSSTVWRAQLAAGRPPPLPATAVRHAELLGHATLVARA